MEKKMPTSEEPTKAETPAPAPAPKAHKHLDLEARLDEVIAELNRIKRILANHSIG